MRDLDWGTGGCKSIRTDLSITDKSFLGQRIEQKSRAFFLGGGEAEYQTRAFGGRASFTYYVYIGNKNGRIVSDLQQHCR